MEMSKLICGQNTLVNSPGASRMAQRSLASLPDLAITASATEPASMASPITASNRAWSDSSSSPMISISTYTPCPVSIGGRRPRASVPRW